MFLSKVTLCVLLAIVVTADKKIELQDIEEDNIRSEKQTRREKSEGRHQGPNAVVPTSLAQLEYLKNGLLHYFEPAQQPQQPRYVQQYDVTEQPEISPGVTPKTQYGPPAQQTMQGYLSNIPIQIYFVPQYYNEPIEQGSHSQSEAQITAPAIDRSPTYHEPQHAQQQANYIEVPAYVTPTGKPYVQPYTSPVIYVTHAQPTIAPAQATVTPVLYQMPVVHYSTAVAASPSKEYYQSQPQYTETNSVDEEQEHEYNIHKQYSTHSEIPSTKQSGSDIPRYYNSRAPIREEYRTPVELPHPNSVILKAPPSHLSHIPKVLPEYRPALKPVYTTGGGFTSNTFAQKPSGTYTSIPFKRRPTSLLDSYIPSSVQIEYMKKGYVRDPLVAYEALSNARFLSHTPANPRHYERGFLPNQMYHTAAGGITFGHHKRAPKLDKVAHQ